MKHLGFSATLESIKRKRVEATSSGIAAPAVKAETSKRVESTSKRPPATKAKAKAKPTEATDKIKPKNIALAAELDGCLPPLGSFQGLYSGSD